MKRIVTLLAAMVVAVPAWGALVDYFPVAADGSFDIYRSGTPGKATRTRAPGVWRASSRRTSTWAGCPSLAQWAL